MPSGGDGATEAQSQRAIEARDPARRFGGIQLDAAFSGWAASIGLAAILISALIGAGVAVGLAEIGEGADAPAKEVGFAGGVLVVAIIALSYLAGGYIAARMARYDGVRQGVAVWAIGVAMTLALAATAWIAGGDVDPLRALELPRIPVEEDELTRGGAITVFAVAIVTLVAAAFGGRLGERFNRDLDRAITEGSGELLSPTDPAPEA